MLLESIFSFYKRSKLLFRDVIVAAMFISNLGEKTELGESRGCQIDKKRVILDITSEFPSIKLQCIKFTSIYLSYCGAEERPMVAESKFLLLQIVHDFIFNTLSTEVIMESLKLYEFMHQVLDDPFDRIGMDTYLSTILDDKHHQFNRIETTKQEVKKAVNKSRRNSISRKTLEARSSIAGSRLNNTLGTSGESITENLADNQSQSSIADKKVYTELDKNQKKLQEILCQSITFSHRRFAEVHGLLRRAAVHPVRRRPQDLPRHAAQPLRDADIEHRTLSSVVV